MHKTIATLSSLYFLFYCYALDTKQDNGTSITNPPLNTTGTTYYLQDNFSGSTFFDNFSFETMDDPTHGYVDYVDKDTAFNQGLAQFWGDQVYMGVDHTNIVGDNDRGRKSIRITSNKMYNGNNLIVIDAEHMPSSTGTLPNGCGLWPAFWMVGPNWPNSGEIDIIEYVNDQTSDLTTLHTSDNCNQASEDTSSFTGTWATGIDNNTPATDCSVYSSTQWSNQGCGINGWNQPVGSTFNTNKGGIYALEWIPDQFIRAFYFSRENIPQDLLKNLPQPDSWGLPYAKFLLNNNICSSNHFNNNQIVFDTTFCGDWAGNNFPNMCSSSISCNDYVKYNPTDFNDAYWLINYVHVYSSTGSSA